MYQFVTVLNKNEALYGEISHFDKERKDSEGPNQIKPKVKTPFKVRR